MNLPLAGFLRKKRRVYPAFFLRSQPFDRYAVIV
jgi:hypothetical protein